MQELQSVHKARCHVALQTQNLIKCCALCLKYILPSSKIKIKIIFHKRITRHLTDLIVYLNTQPFKITP